MSTKFVYKINWIILFFLGSAFYLKLDSKRLEEELIEKKRKEREQKNEENGYSSLLIDNLHRYIQENFSYFKDLKEEDEKGVERISIQITSRELVHFFSGKYLYHVRLYIYPDKSQKKLEKIMIRFDKFNPHLTEFRRERREIVNPSPHFAKVNEKPDKNDDIRIEYYENNNFRKNDFNKISSLILKEIPSYKEKIDLIRIYTKYLKKAVKNMKRHIEHIKISDRLFFRKMLDVN